MVAGAFELIWSSVCLRRLALLAGVLATLTIVRPCLLFAASQSYEGRPVSAIVFDPAEQSLDSRELNDKVAAVSIGQPLRMVDIRKAIEALYDSGRYEDIQVDAQADPNGPGVAIRFITTPAVFIRNVVVNDVPEPPNQGQLVTSTKLQLGAQFSTPDLKQSEENVLESLRSDGFYLATLQSRADGAEHQQVDVTIDVDAGDRAKFTDPVLTGHPDRTPQQIVRATRWKRFFGLDGWQQVTQERVSRGLDRVRNSYQKQDYLRAKINLERMDYHEDTNTVTPVLNIEAGPKVVIQTHGAKVRKGKLRQLVPVYEEGAVDKDLLVEGQRNLKEFFQAKGYFEADVDFDVDDTAKNLQTIDYSIAPGERHKFTYLQITGNKYFDTETIRERMYLVPATFPRFRRGRYSASYLRRDIDAITSLYQANGFRDVKVDSKVEDDYEGIDNVAVFLNITEGPQWLVNSLNFDGLDNAQKNDVLARTRSTRGQPYSDFNVANDQDAILNYFFNNGYPDATFEAVVKESTTPTSMDLTYVVHPGDRQFVRDVLVSGIRATNEQLVRDRIQNLQPGEPLSQEAMNQSQRRLYDLGVFARVDAALQNPDGDERYKYVLYRIEEAHKYLMNIGFGAQFGRIGRGDVNSLESAGGSSDFSPRVSFGLARINLWGLGHTVGLQARYSDVQKRVLVNYLAPQFKGNENLSLTFTALYDESFDVNTFNAKRQEGSVQLSQRLTKANTLQYRLAYRRVSIDPNSITITPALIPLYSQPVQLGIISTTFIQDRRDDPADARRGIYNTLDTGFSSSIIGSKTSFTRIIAKDATYHPLRRSLVFARSTTFGVISKFSGPDIPLPERFFAGGASSHRGFAENQAGPRDTGSGVIIGGQQFNGTGFPVGGRALLLNTLEMRFPLLGENIGGVLFHDAGNVYSKLGNMSFRFNQRDLTDFDYMVHAIGFGLRYRTPIGPIRIDLGIAINPPEFNGLKGTRDQLLDPNLTGVQFIQQRLSHFQIHFSLGQAF
jgi:outer membrane protein insertion porin family